MSYYAAHAYPGMMSYMPAALPGGYTPYAVDPRLAGMYAHAPAPIPGYVHPRTADPLVLRCSPEGDAWQLSPLPHIAQRFHRLLAEDDRRRDMAERTKKIEKRPREVRREPPAPNAAAASDKEVKLGNIVFRVARGDWQCTDKKCLNWNYAKRSRCNICKRAREGGAGAVRGAEADEDQMQGSWACRKCDFKNYPSRGICYRCGDERPFQTLG